MSLPNYESYRGITKIMTWNAGCNDYVPLGQQISQFGDWASSGSAVSLSSDGQILAVGTYDADVNISNGGNVRVFKLTTQSTTLVSPAPSNMNAYQYSATIYRMTITGAVSGGTIYGSGTYRIDSNIAMAAVHAGFVSNGETKEVYIIMEFAQSYYFSITRNGITSTSFQQSEDTPYDSYYFMASPKLWIQIGNDIYGSQNEFLGFASSLSSDGTIIAVGGSGLLKTFSLSTVGKFTYTSSDTSVASIYGDIVVLNSAGTTIITASAGTTIITASSYDFFESNSSARTLTVLTAFDSATFAVPSAKTIIEAPFAITTAPTSASDGAITYASSNDAVATIHATTGEITLVSAGGPMYFTATQAATAVYAGATCYSNTLTVSLATSAFASATFAVPSTKTNVDAPFAITTAPSSASDGAITYASSNTAVATIHATTGEITPVDAGGPMYFTATQAATATYAGATRDSNTLTVSIATSLAGQTLTGNLAGKDFTGTSFAGATIQSGVSLAGATLSGVNFTGATLSGVNFAGATVTGTNFANANIVGATNLPEFSIAQKLQLLRNANNSAIGAVQFSSQLTGADINAAITSPVSAIAGASFVIKAPSYNELDEKVVTVISTDVSGNASIYIPLNDNETVKINGVAYTLDGTNVLDADSNIITFFTILNKPYRLYSGSIIGLNVSETLNSIKFAGTGLYDIFAEIFAFKS